MTTKPLTQLGPTDFIGPTEAANYLRIGRKTAYHWIHQGYFPHHRMGKLIKIRVADLDAFLEKTRVGESPAPVVNSSLVV